MPRNNQAQDRYNPPGVQSVDWDTSTFGELEVNDLFFLSQEPDGAVNVIHRKISLTEAQHLRTREVTNPKGNLKVHLKL